MSAVLTWIVHGAVLVIVLSLGLRLARGLDAASRYCLWWAAMAAVLALPGVHAIWPSDEGNRELHAAIASATQDVPASIDTSTGDPASAFSVPTSVILPSAARAAAPFLVVAGAAFVLWRLLALVQAAVTLRRVRARCQPLPDGLEARLAAWTQVRERGREARLLVSPDLAGPAVLGPVMGERAAVIALPAWSIDTLDPESLDLIVLHEHAHVERYDDRDLLVQSAIEAVFCWHPAVWWIARRLNEERERACDDVVVRRTGRPAQYARCLVAVAAHGVRTPRLLAAPGVGRPGRRLADRVERLLAARPTARTAARFAWTGAVALGLTTIAVSAAVWPRVHVIDPTWDRIAASFMISSTSETQRATAKRDLRVGTGLPGTEPSTIAPVAGPASVALRATASAAGRGRQTIASRSRERRPLDAAPRADRERRPALAADTPSPVVPRAASNDTASAMAAPTAPAAVLSDAARSASATGEPIASGPLPSTSFQQRFAPTPGAHMTSAPPSLPQPGPWKRTADAGESIGRGAATAGVKTAGFFSRMGRAIASSF